MRSDDEERLKRFLLGELSEPDAERVERRLLEDDELFELAEALEWELLEDCARGRLAPEEDERVRARLASTPQGKRRLALAGNLGSVARGRSRDAEATTGQIVPFPRRRPPEARARRWAALAAAVLLALLGAWLGIRQLGTGAGDAPPEMEARQAPAPPPAEPPAAEGGRLAGPTPEVPEIAQVPEATPPARPEPPGRSEPAVLQLALAALRGAGDLPRLEVPAGTERVEIQLDVTGYEGYEAFDAVLRDAARQEVAWRAAELHPRHLDGGPTLVLEIPAEDLPAGRYELEVGARTAEGTREELSFQELEIARRP